jgi:hypothetical protein
MDKELHNQAHSQEKKKNSSKSNSREGEKEIRNPWKMVLAEPKDDVLDGIKNWEDAEISGNQSLVPVKIRVGNNYPNLDKLSNSLKLCNVRRSSDPEGKVVKAMMEASHWRDSISKSDPKVFFHEWGSKKLRVEVESDEGVFFFTNREVGKSEIAQVLSKALGEEFTDFSFISSKAPSKSSYRNLILFCKSEDKLRCLRLKSVEIDGKPCKIHTPLESKWKLIVHNIPRTAVSNDLRRFLPFASGVNILTKKILLKNEKNISVASERCFLVLCGGKEEFMATLLALTAKPLKFFSRNKVVIGKVGVKEIPKDQTEISATFFEDSFFNNKPDLSADMDVEEIRTGKKESINITVEGTAQNPWLINSQSSPTVEILPETQNPSPRVDLTHEISPTEARLLSVIEELRKEVAELKARVDNLLRPVALHTPRKQRKDKSFPSPTWIPNTPPPQTTLKRPASSPSGVFTQLENYATISLSQKMPDQVFFPQETPQSTLEVGGETISSETSQ